jgi:hypothetical protein
MIYILIPAIIFGFLFFAILLNFIPVLFSHYRSLEELAQFKNSSSSDIAYSFTGLKMKYYWSSGNKHYINMINRCDIYLSNEYFVAVPYQTFLIKLYHKPVLIKKANTVVSKTEIEKHFVPAKITFKEGLKQEIEIYYGDLGQKYQIRLMDLSNEQRKQFEIIRNWI